MATKKPAEEKQDYAKVVWRVEDVLSKAEELGIKMTENAAHDFLEGNERRIAEDMIGRGWDSIETLLQMEKYRASTDKA